MASGEVGRMEVSGRWSRARARDVSAAEAACLPRLRLALGPAETSRVRREVQDGDIALPFVRQRRFLRLFIFAPFRLLLSLSPALRRPLHPRAFEQASKETRAHHARVETATR